MIVKYDTEKLNKLICDLSSLLGISISFLDRDFCALTECKSQEGFCATIQSSKKGKELCVSSDAAILGKCTKTLKFESHICHAGLCDAAMPIIKNGEIVGYIIMGRIRTDIDETEIARRNAWFGENTRNIIKNYRELSYFTPDRIESLRSLLSYVIFDSAIEIEQDELITRATEYINANIQNDLSVSLLCSKLGASKNVLYKCFDEFYGMTLGEYITVRRISKAKELLEKTNDPVYLVAEKVGIGNYTYFCRLFSKQVGISPLKYRKSIKSNH
ncbi:MAG: PocR ligand-binding domain-containing protein [Clostridia bacterium]|nr:PocR ligand-binding domain-containing protein [Clostridia bacterium]